jgi:hypothetical protein
LEIARERIEAEPSTRADIGEPHFLASPEDSPPLRDRDDCALGVVPIHLFGTLRGSGDHPTRERV